MSPILLAVVAGLVLGSFIFGMLVLVYGKHRQYGGSFISLLMSVILLLSAALISLVTIGIKGYRALTHEELVATVQITPLGSQQFQAKIIRPGIPDTALIIAGDEFYIDSRILKWKPFANLIGVHTYYCLDRVSGRYEDIRDESTKLRTLYSLSGPERRLDLFFLVKRFPFLALLLDAQYGSASFVSAKQAKVLRVMVSTSGLLIRSE